MTSIEIAEVTGKQHKNVMQAIRNMESAWEKVNGLKFQLVEYLSFCRSIRHILQINTYRFLTKDKISLSPDNLSGSCE